MLNILPRFRRPADEATVQAVTLYVPPDPSEAPAGWLMFDPSTGALEWISAHLDDGGSVTAIVAAEARAAVLRGIRDGRTAGQVWKALRRVWLSRAPRATTAAGVRAETAQARTTE